MNVKNKSTLMSLSTKRGSWIKATKTRKNNNWFKYWRSCSDCFE